MGSELLLWTQTTLAGIAAPGGKARTCLIKGVRDVLIGALW